MLYLRENPLLREPLTFEHIKSRLLGHSGSDAGQIFTYVHMNRLIRKYGIDAMYISGPGEEYDIGKRGPRIEYALTPFAGHEAPAVLSQVYLEGVYTEFYPNVAEDQRGIIHFFRQFSFPGGIGSYATRLRDHSTRDGSSVTPSRALSGRCLTTQTESV